MIIKKIDWLSKEAKEALVYINSKDISFIAFSHPCNLKSGDENLYRIYCLDAKNIRISNLKKPSITQNLNDLGCNIIGKILDKSKNLILVNDICIEIDIDFPNDVNDGSFVEFNCNRLDLY